MDCTCAIETFGQIRLSGLLFDFLRRAYEPLIMPDSCLARKPSRRSHVHNFSGPTMHTRSLTHGCLVVLAIATTNSTVIAGFQGLNLWTGLKVFLKDDAANRRSDGSVRKTPWLSPSMVKWVDGRRLYVDGAWVKRSDVRTIEEAIDYYSTEVQQNPDNLLAWRRLGRCQMERRDWPAAVKMFGEAIRLKQDDTYSHYMRSQAKHHQKDYDGSIADLDEAIRLFPSNATLYAARGLVKTDKRDYDGAIHDYDEAIRRNPKNANAFFGRGRAEVHKPDYDAGLRDLDEAIRLDPTYYEAYVERAIAKVKKEQYAEAIRDYNEALRIGPRWAAVYQGRGDAKMHLADYGGAIRDFDEAIRRKPEDAFARSDKAFLLAVCADEKYRNAKESLALADTALALEPKSRFCKRAKACALALNGHFDTAIALQTEIVKEGHPTANEKRAAEARINAWKQKQQWVFQPGK
jgi:tetratricopeptide (TPR) repeat protein